MAGKWVPDWLAGYKRSLLPGDLIAGLIVTVMLIPQSLAYAMLAGLPPEVGLYASILPLIAYALFGSSMTLAVGPVAVASLMTASALQPLAATGSPEYVALAVQLSLISGVLLFVFGLLKLGFLAHFLSHPVISGFISGSAILIALGQTKYIFGLKFAATGAVETAVGLVKAIPGFNPATTAIGVGTLIFLVFSRKYLSRLLVRMGIKANLADLLVKLMPMVAVIIATAIASAFQLHQTHGVGVVGHVPQGLPSLGLSFPDWHGLSVLWLPALLISLVGFVESVSVAQSLALKRQQRINADKELLGLGAANLASALSGGYPVTGGFARSVVNFAAGANTPFAGVISAILMSGVIAGMTGLFYMLPHAVLAATIIVAVTSLIDFSSLKEAWQYDRADAFALLATMAGVIFMGVEAGIVLGVGLSLAVLVWRSSRPHMAVVGRVAATEHFRNIERHQVETLPGLIALRVDESLFFGNASVMEEKVEHLIADHPATTDFLVILSAVNRIDTTALGVLNEIEGSLSQRGIRLHLAEVKGPVMDRLKTTGLGARLRDRVYLSTHEAVSRIQASQKG